MVKFSLKTYNISNIVMSHVEIWNWKEIDIIWIISISNCNIVNPFVEKYEIIF